jgi:iron complex transport system substrate-binding protein
MIFRLKTIFTLLIFLIISSCQQPQIMEEGRESVTPTSIKSLTIKDASNTEITFTQTPQKIICLHLSCIDILAELGIEPLGVHNRLHHLAVNPIYFGKEKDFVKIAGFAEPNLEQLLFLQPDLVIGHVAQLASQRQTIEKVAPLFLLDVTTYQDTIENLQTIGKITGKTAEAEAAIQVFLAKLQKYKAKSPKNQRVLVTNGTTGTFYVASDKSLVGSTLAELAEYPPSPSQDNFSAINWMTLSQEEILRLDPDVIFVLVPSASQDFLAQLQNHGFWQSLKAVKTGRIYQIEEAQVGGLTTGTRSLSRLLDEIMPKLYPNIF